MKFTNPDTSVISEKELYIFDMDGTVNLGGIPFDFAIEFIKNLRKSGKRVLFFTNNASHISPFYKEKLQRLGFEPRDGEIMTSGDVTLEFLKAYRRGCLVYMVATEELVADYKARGIKVLNGAERIDTADIVITSFDTTLTYEKLDTACRLIRNGAEYISTHPDFNCPTENGFIPDSGAIAAFVTASTGKVPTYFGKPYKETIEMIGSFTGLDKEQMCVFGDRLYTDIALGKNFGVTSVLVLSGETTVEDLDSADTEKQPDFAFASLADVNELMFGK